MMGVSPDPPVPADARNSGDASQPKLGWFGRTAINVGLLITSIVAAVGIGEVMIRLVAPQQLILIRPDMWQPADSVGWLARPNVRTRVNMGEQTVNYLTDADGFRVGRRGRVEADKEVLLLGDSFMEALQVEYEQSLAGLIERHSVEDFGEQVAVRNAAVGGWGPNQYLIRAKQLLARHQYDAVLVMVFTGNDVIMRKLNRVLPRTPVDRATLRFPKRFSRKEWTSSVAQPINDFLEVRSHLFVFVKKKLRWLTIRANLSHAYFPTVLLRTEATSRRWDITTDILADLAAVTRERGVPILFVLLPSNVQVQQDELRGYMAALEIDSSKVDVDQPNRLLEQRLSDRAVPHADVLPELRRAGGRGVRLYGRVDPHFTAAGHRVLWDAVRPTLARLIGAADKQEGQPTNGSSAHQTGAGVPR